MYKMLKTKTSFYEMSCCFSHKGTIHIPTCTNARNAGQRHFYEFSIPAIIHDIQLLIIINYGEHSYFPIPVFRGVNVTTR